MNSPAPRPHRGFAILTFLWVFAIFWVNTRPGSHLPSTGWLKLPCLDKVAHFTMFGGLAALLWRTVVPADPLRAASVRWPAVFCFLVAAAAGGIDELQQIRVPGRAAELADWIADAGGALVVVAMAAALRASAVGKRPKSCMSHRQASGVARRRPSATLPTAAQANSRKKDLSQWE